MKQLNRNQLAAAVFGAVVTQAALVSPVFAYEVLPQGYQNQPLTQPDGFAEQEKTAEQKTQEGKCGEGKCGEGKCGESKKVRTGTPKLGQDTKNVMQGKCGEGRCGEAKKAEGKCGEGKCGADKKTKEGKCGEEMHKKGAAKEGEKK